MDKPVVRMNERVGWPMKRHMNMGGVRDFVGRWVNKIFS